MTGLRPGRVGPRSFPVLASKPPSRPTSSRAPEHADVHVLERVSFRCNHRRDRKGQRMDEVAQVTYTTSGVGAGVIVLWFVVVYAIAVIPYWVVFTKAGQPGWPALIPIYSTYILLKVIGRPGWWLLLFLVPLLNIVIRSSC